MTISLFGTITGNKIENTTEGWWGAEGEGEGFSTSQSSFLYTQRWHREKENVISFRDPENPFRSKQFMKTQTFLMNQEVTEFQTYLFHFLNAHLCSWHDFFVSQVWSSRLHLLFFYVLAKDSQVSRFPPILLLNHCSQCLWQKIIEESIRFLEGWRDGFPPLDMPRVWFLWDVASLTFVYFLSFFFKRSLQFWIVWILQKEKKRCWSSTWEVAGKEGELSENGVQPSEQFFRICPCSSGPVSKWATQFAWPWIASFFLSLKEVFNQKKSGFNIHVLGIYLLNRSNVLL